MGRRTPEDVRYATFERSAWKALRGDTPLSLSPSEIDAVRSLNDPLTKDEVEDIYLPLDRLLRLLHGTRGAASAEDRFLSRSPVPKPIIVGIAGSVAVGKSTIARLIETLCLRWPEVPRVSLVATDGFLLPNEALKDRGLMDRKGFPESYDAKRLIDFLTQLKLGAPKLRIPLYSHLEYDVLRDSEQLVEAPHIVLLEGLNILQSTNRGTLVSDFIDFSIYVDASPEDLKRWYIERFLTLYRTTFISPRSYFHKLSNASTETAISFASERWDTINLKNLRENILPTRERASLILKKAADHHVERVLMRQF